MTDEQIAMAQDLRNSGVSYRKIASAIGVSSSSLYSKLNPERKKAHDARYYASHKDRFRIRNAEYRATHKEELRQYRADHIDEIHLREKKHRDARREERRLYQVKYNRERKEEARDYAVTYYKNHREQRLAYAAAYRKAHLSECVALNNARRALKIGATIGNLAEIKEIYRQAREDAHIRCYLCGETIPFGNRHVDHKVPLSKGGAHAPSNLAVACAACNLGKGSKLPCNTG